MIKLFVFIIILIVSVNAQTLSETENNLINIDGEPAELSGELGLSLSISSGDFVIYSVEQEKIAGKTFGIWSGDVYTGIVRAELTMQEFQQDGLMIKLKNKNGEEKGSLILGSQEKPTVDGVVNIQNINLNDVKIPASELSVINDDLSFKGVSFDMFIDDVNTGKFSIGVSLLSTAELSEEEIVSMRVTERNDAVEVDVGEIIFNSVNIDLLEIARVITTFNGNVMSASGELIKKGQVCVSAEQIEECVFIKNGNYIVVVEGKANNNIEFKVNGVSVGTKALAPEISDVRYDLTVDMSIVNFADADMDGLPDVVDKCPNSLVWDVDVNGCDCSQKQCGVGRSCVLDFFWGNKCVEKGIERCSEITKCVQTENSAPKFCNEDGFVVNNCQACGCPSDFSCGENGDCVKVLTGLVGSLCKDNDFFYSLDKIECPEGWVKEELKKYISFSVKAPPFVKQKAKKKIRRVLDSATLCLKTSNLGCAPPDNPYKCHFEDLLEKNRGKAAGIVENSIRNNMPPVRIPAIGRATITTVSFGGLFFPKSVRITPHVDISEFKIRETYECSPKIVTSDVSCMQLINNGPAEKRVDIVFVGDGYLDDESFVHEIHEMIDYASEYSMTEKEGLFSIEPFKSHKTKFNVWAVNAKDNIQYDIRSASFSDGWTPKDDDVNNFASRCPNKDYVVVVSKQPYRSFCFFGGKGNCFVSVGNEQYKGRLLLHEFGHGFASLEDEYTNEAPELKNAPERIEELITDIRTDAANCHPDEASAEQQWGVLINESNALGYFRGCGGDCLPYCKDAVRPTLNSVMRYQEQTTGNPEDCRDNPLLCRLGPPFDTYYAVNEREIIEELDKYEAGKPEDTVIWMPKMSQEQSGTLRFEKKYDCQINTLCDLPHAPAVYYDIDADVPPFFPPPADADVKIGFGVELSTNSQGITAEKLSTSKIATVQKVFTDVNNDDCRNALQTPMTEQIIDLSGGGITLCVQGNEGSIMKFGFPTITKSIKTTHLQLPENCGQPNQPVCNVLNQVVFNYKIEFELFIPNQVAFLN